MTNKEFVLSVYPNAKCITKNSSLILNKYCRYDIISIDKLFVTSFISEDAAWSWAASIINLNLITQLTK